MGANKRFAAINERTINNRRNVVRIFMTFSTLNVNGLLEFPDLAVAWLDKGVFIVAKGPFRVA